MKKLFILLTLCLYIFSIGCKSDSSKESSNTSDTKETASNETDKDATDDDSKNTEVEDLENAKTEEAIVDGSETSAVLKWPNEFKLWNVPIVDNVTLTAANNQSVTGDILSQGLVAVVEITGLDMDGFKAYGETLVKEGFVVDPASVPGALEYYTREDGNGIITLTMAFGDDRSSIIVSNAAAEGEKAAASTSTGAETWPETLTEIPEFTYGTFKEVIDMTSGMYTITYTDVTQENIDTYKNELSDQGFMIQNDDGNEMYFKLVGSTSHAIGFNYINGTLQLILMTSDM